jgi:hypothetical protein
MIPSKDLRIPHAQEVFGIEEEAVNSNNGAVTAIGQEATNRSGG